MDTEKIDALYAQLPTINCQQRCAGACGPIMMSPGERQRIAEAGVEIPDFTVEGAMAYAGQGRHCPALRQHPLIPEVGLCTVYEARPMICRLWGLVESMPCPWGCVPSRMLTDEEGRAFLRAATVLGT